MGSATVPVAPVGVSPTESNCYIAGPVVNSLGTKLMFGADKPVPPPVGQASPPAGADGFKPRVRSGKHAAPCFGSRREMLQRMCTGFGVVGLAGLLGPEALAAASAERRPHFAPRAKRVIFLFLNGGPSHVDTFDPKPALKAYAGQQPAGGLYPQHKRSGLTPSPSQLHPSCHTPLALTATLPHPAP